MNNSLVKLSFQILPLNKRSNVPVSLTWFLSSIFLYKTMTKGCYMLNINAFRPVVHVKKDV